MREIPFLSFHQPEEQKKLKMEMKESKESKSCNPTQGCGYDFT